MISHEIFVFRYHNIVIMIDVNQKQISGQMYITSSFSNLSWSFLKEEA